MRVNRQSAIESMQCLFVSFINDGSLISNRVRRDFGPLSLTQTGSIATPAFPRSKSSAAHKAAAQRAPQSEALDLRLAGRMGRTTIRVGQAFSFWHRTRLQQRTTGALARAGGVNAKRRRRHASRFTSFGPRREIFRARSRSRCRLISSSRVVFARRFKNTTQRLSMARLVHETESAEHFTVRLRSARGSLR